MTDQLDLAFPSQSNDEGGSNARRQQQRLTSDAPADTAWGAVITWAGATRVAATDAGIREIHLPDWHAGPPVGSATPQITISQDASPDAHAHLASALSQLAAFFMGDPIAFDMPLDMQGPAFQCAVWQAVAAVPYGETRSYLDIALELGNPAATRAVGLANGANPLAPVVPCHRIVGNDGRLTGYGPGMSLKRRLLAMEGVMPLTDGDADYAEWVARLPSGALLGVRATKALCRPTCARARRYADRCPRIFSDSASAIAAGFAPCPACHPMQPALMETA